MQPAVRLHLPDISTLFFRPPRPTYRNSYIGRSLTGSLI